MRSPKTLIYALLTWIGVIGIYYYYYHTIPSLSLGTIGLVLGLAGGVYLDISRSERDVSDNIAFGMMTAAIFRLADVWYGISELTPSAYKMGLIAISIATIAAALTSEASRGVPGKIPIMGLLAVGVAFLLVFSAVTTVEIQKTTRSTNIVNPTASRAEGLNYAKHYESSSTASTLVLYDPINATSAITLTISAYTRVDASSVSHTSDRVIYVGILIRTPHSNFTRVAGEYEFELTFSTNVTTPEVHLFGYLAGSRNFDKLIFESDDNQSVSITIRVNITASEASILNNMNRVGIEAKRLDVADYPALPFSITVARSQVKEQTISRSYMIASIIAMAIATIDALPLDAVSVKRTTRRRRRTSRRKKRSRSTARRR